MSKKAEQKRKEKVIEDRTFGLKNKNRSSKVQAYVQQVSKAVNQANPNDKRAIAEAEERRRAKENKKAMEAEMAMLFRSADADSKKKNGAEGEEGEEAFEYNPDDYLFRPEDFEDVEVDGRRLEEKLETEREALEGRTDLTPVTEESFQAWKKAKREAAAKEEAERVKKARAGQGKMRGWDLWQMDKDLFVDDDDADEFYEREAEEEGGESEGEEFDLS